MIELPLMVPKVPKLEATALSLWPLSLESIQTHRFFLPKARAYIGVGNKKNRFSWPERIVEINSSRPNCILNIAKKSGKHWKRIEPRYVGWHCIGIRWKNLMKWEFRISGTLSAWDLEMVHGWRAVKCRISGHSINVGKAVGFCHIVNDAMQNSIYLIQEYYALGHWQRRQLTITYCRSSCSHSGVQVGYLKWRGYESSMPWQRVEKMYCTYWVTFRKGFFVNSHRLTIFWVTWSSKIRNCLFRYANRKLCTINLC